MNPVPITVVELEDLTGTSTKRPGWLVPEDSGLDVSIMHETQVGDQVGTAIITKSGESIVVTEQLSLMLKRVWHRS